MKKILFTLFFIICFNFVGLAQKNPTEEANKLVVRGDVKGAIAVLNKAVEKNKNLFEIYRMRSFLHGMLGNLKAEFDDLSKAIELKSTEGSLYELRARTRMFLRQDASLILGDLDSAIANGYKIDKVYSLRAMFRRQNGDIEGAFADYQTAVGLNPESAASTLGLASTYQSKNDDAQAILVLENFLYNFENSSEKLPAVRGKVVAQGNSVIKEKNMAIGRNAVVIYDEKNTKPTSREEAQKFGEKMEQTKNISLAYTNLASLYEKRGDFEKALNTVKEAIKINSTDAHAVGVRGKIKGSMKNYAGAIEDLSRAIEATPFFPNYYIDRGFILVILNREDEAQKDFDEYLKIVSSPSAERFLDKKIAEARKTREASN